MSFTLITISDIKDGIRRLLGRVAITNAAGTREMVVNDDGSINAGVTGSVVVASSALPAGAATSAKQDLIIGELQDIETDIEGIGTFLSTQFDVKASELLSETTGLEIKDVLSDIRLDTTAIKEYAENIDGNITKCDTDNIGGSIDVDNLPTSFPLPDAQVVDLVGFLKDANITTNIVTVGAVRTITETDGVKTLTTTIDKTDLNNIEITEVWS